VEPLNVVYRATGVPLPETFRVTDDAMNKSALSKALVLAPPSAAGTPWLRRFGDYSDAFASGWMQLRGARRRRGVDRGFVMSDHADWPALHHAIGSTQAGQVFVTHGSIAVMVRYLREQGLDAHAFATEYGGEEEADPAHTETSLSPGGLHSNPTIDTALSSGKDTDAAEERHTSDAPGVSGFSPASSAAPFVRPLED
jgi:putative mRNA 3-end processing factor